MSNTSEEELYYDIENNPIHIKYNKYDETIDINGILKKDNPEEEKRLNYMISFIYMMGIIIISIPFIFCDFYYSFTDVTCVYISPEKLNINLKIYLIVSGCFNIISLICLIINCYYLPSRTNVFEIRQITKILVLVASFINFVTFVNNIVGSILFWGTLYREICSSNLSTYIFISLIIKFVANIRHALMPFMYSDNPA
tara:strand:+ start:232 stop:825 length:594 start_codon:yes stop_codon:yes gene_type:complete